MPAPASASAEQIKDANVRYHDAAAAEYDSKWGIDFGDLGQRLVTAKLEKALGRRPAVPFGEALEIGGGTGFFSLNLMQAGLIERLTATDISPGMLATLSRTAADLGLSVETVACEAESLPFEDESVDLVFGHAILHHIPNLDRAFDEFQRVLRPGGTIVFCGEPSRYGDRLAAIPKRSALAIAPLWRRLVGASARPAVNGSDAHDHDLESVVDVHAFLPAELGQPLARAGFDEIRIAGEELLASLYGWTLRTLESSADATPDGWRLFAFRTYMAIQRIDEGLLERRLPAFLFYNLLVSATKPG